MRTTESFSNIHLRDEDHLLCTCASSHLHSGVIIHTKYLYTPVCIIEPGRDPKCTMSWKKNWSGKKEPGENETGDGNREETTDHVVRVGERVDEKKTTGCFGDPKKRLGWMWRSNWRVKEGWRGHRESTERGSSKDRGPSKGKEKQLFDGEEENGGVFGAEEVGVGRGQGRREVEGWGLRQVRTGGYGSAERAEGLGRSQTEMVRRDTYITVGEGNNIHGKKTQNRVLGEAEKKQAYGTYVNGSRTLLNATQLSDRRSKETHYNDTHMDGTHLDGATMHATQSSNRAQSGTQLNDTGAIGNDREAKRVNFSETAVEGAYQYVSSGAAREETVDGNQALEEEGRPGPRRLTVQDFVDQIQNDPYAFMKQKSDPPPAPNQAKPVHQPVKRAGDEPLLVTKIVEQLYKDPAGFINRKPKAVVAPQAVIFGSEAARAPELDLAPDFIPDMPLFEHTHSPLKEGKHESPKQESGKPEPRKSEPTKPGPTKPGPTKPELTTPGSHLITVQDLVAQVTEPTAGLIGGHEIHHYPTSGRKPGSAESGTSTVPALPTANEPMQNMKESGNERYNLAEGAGLTDGFPRVGSMFTLKGSLQNSPGGNRGKVVGIL